MRKALYVGCLVGFSDNIPMAQVPLVAINSFVIFAFTVLLKPYKERKDMFLNTFNEGIICCLMICALILLNDQVKTHWMAYSDNIILGWVVVGICGVLVLVNAGFMIQEILQTYRQWISFIRSWWRKRKTRKSHRGNRGRKAYREEKREMKKVGFNLTHDLQYPKKQLTNLNYRASPVSPSFTGSVRNGSSSQEPSSKVDISLADLTIAENTNGFLDDNNIISTHHRTQRISLLQDRTQRNRSRTNIPESKSPKVRLTPNLHLQYLKSAVKPNHQNSSLRIARKVRFTQNFTNEGKVSDFEYIMKPRRPQDT